MAQHTDQQPDAEEDELLEAEEDTELSAEEELLALKAELEDLREKAARAQADYQNLRRRGQADYEAGLKRALEPLLFELLLVLDFLDLALASPTTLDESKNLALGVEMTRTKFLQALESVEVHPIPAGGRFDPQLHEAAGARFVPDTEAGTILETVRTGYTWQEAVLRPAQVVVAAEDEQSAASASKQAQAPRDEA